MPIIKPSDTVSWISCARRVCLDNHGGFEFEPIKDKFEQLIIELGLAHDKAVLAHGEEGLIDDYEDMFGISRKLSVLRALNALGKQKREANKLF